MRLHEKILYCRKRAGLSQEALAERVGVSRQAVSKWETDESLPETGKLAALAAALGVSVDWLLSEEEPEQADYFGGAGSAGRRPERDWTETLPGFLRQAVRRWGWLVGVYTAVCGLLFCLLGGVASYVSGQILSSFNSGLNAFGGFGPMGSGGMAAPANPVSILGNVMMIIGAILFIAGVVLAVTLKRRSRR